VRRELVTGPHSRTQIHAALSLVELLVVIALIALLGSLLHISYFQFQERARKAKCIGNMRALYAALSFYVDDKGMWPQLEEGRDYSEEEFFEFWITSTEAYGASHESWVCPSDRVLERRINERQVKYFGSYVPTQFDRFPSTPYRWNQPWAIERGVFHGRSSHMLMPDGSVQETINPFYGR